ncbi:hypothetical protein FPCIR_12739 [Fusarium pseudocircinatum]|uniref:Uncharacterized protein n=1 Tax=Fusarium pseudocircinatum TaxID=56676 RepID=A0A8H5NR95_9HYPO|nr:hypothetical protein FPCIR_12739 [Fusarium pseudocircinatum]
MSMQRGSNTPNTGQKSWSNSQELSDAIEESKTQLEAEVKAVLSELDQTRTAALQAEKEREGYETVFKDLQKQYKTLKEESEQKDRRIEELEQALKRYEDRTFPSVRRSWREFHNRR